MILRAFLFVLTVATCFSCNTNKIDRLTAQNDSLRVELEKVKAIVANFEKATNAIDSMEGFRMIAFDGTQGKPVHQVIAPKIESINAYVIKIAEANQSLREELKSSRHENSAYVLMIDAVKSELEIRVSEVAVLEGSITDIDHINQEITIEKEQAVSRLLLQVNEKQIALNGVEDRLHKLESTFRNVEAEAVYARAVAVEESARKTRFAPSKKREALTEALELYKKAKALGKTEAHINIGALEKFETARSRSKADQTL